MLTDRQNQIISESINIIDKKGIQGLTIKNLSKELGISEPAIYRHFESKFHIFFEILNDFVSRTKKFNKQLIESDLTSLKKIENVFNKHINLFIEKPAIISVIFAGEIFSHDKVLYKKFHEIFISNENHFLKIIEEGQKAGEIKDDIDKNQIVIILMGAFRLLVIKWKQSSYSFDIKTQGGNLFETLKLLIKK
ncbi:MAG: TetR/AcrR family transcriptional regulator [Bacteroidetes bacterium]|nr:TetR/AcrR family transcriptional regulator [Bacteroidota bacterium]